MNNLVDKLADLDLTELEKVISSAKSKRQKKEAKKREERYKRPKEVPVKKFNEYIKRTKALFQGKKYSYPVRLELDLTINKCIAWREAFDPSIVEHNVVVKGNLPKDILKILEETLTDCGGPALFENLDKSNTATIMKEEITKLCEDIDHREKELGLPGESLWEAVYEKCQEYSY